MLPRRLALDRHGNLLLLVPAERVIKLFDPACGIYPPLPGIGGEQGGGDTALVQPGNIAVAGAALYVADPGAQWQHLYRGCPRVQLSDFGTLSLRESGKCRRASTCGTPSASRSAWDPTGIRLPSNPALGLPAPAVVARRPAAPGSEVAPGQISNELQTTLTALLDQVARGEPLGEKRLVDPARLPMISATGRAPSAGRGGRPAEPRSAVLGVW